MSWDIRKSKHSLKYLSLLCWTLKLDCGQLVVAVEHPSDFGSGLWRESFDFSIH